MNFDDFASGLLGDASSLAGTATSAGSQAIYGDITGMNLTPASGTGAASSGMSTLLLLLVGAVILYFIFRKQRG